MNNKQLGFTLIELLMTIVMLGILSASALPKFFETSTFAERAFFDDTINAVRYAQKLAVATGCGVQVAVSSDLYTITREGTSVSTSCPNGSIYSLSVPHPSSGASDYSGAESGITLVSSPVSFVFNALGEASTDVTITVNGSKTISVIAETGFVYEL